MTVAHHSQLSDEEVYEKLGFVNGLPPSTSTSRTPTHASALPPHPPPSMPIETSAAPSSHDTQAIPLKDSAEPVSDEVAPVVLGPPISPADHEQEVHRYIPRSLDLNSQRSSPSEISPPVPEKDYPVVSPSTSQTVHRIPSREATTSIASQTSQRSLREQQPRTPITSHDQSGIEEITPQAKSRQMDDFGPRENMTTPSGQPAPLPRAPPVQINPNPHHFPSNRIVSAPVSAIDSKGISSADLFEEKQNQRGQRKTSLSSRLGQLGSAFGRGSPKSPSLSNPGSPSTPQKSGEPSSPTTNGNGARRSPASPNVSRFINSNLIKNFGRRSSGGITVPISPESAARRSSQPPPPPPKDDEPEYHSNLSSDPAREEYSAVDASASTSAWASNQRSVQGAQELTNQSNLTVDLGDEGDGLIRSASAQKALFDASQKRLKDESEIQDRFRRDEEQRRSRLGVHDAAMDNRFSTVAGIFANGSTYGQGYPTDQASRGDMDGRYSVEREDDVQSEAGLPYDRPDPDSPERSLRPDHPFTQAQLAPSPSAHYAPHQSQTIDTPPPFARGPSAAHLQPHEGLGEEVGADESVTARIAELDLAEDRQAGGTDIEMSIAAERHAAQLRADREAAQEYDAVGNGINTRDSPFVAVVHNEEVAEREQEKLEELAMERRLEPIRMAEAREREDREVERRRQEGEKQAKVDKAKAEEDRRMEEMHLEEERRREEERKQEEERAEKQRLEEVRIAEERRAEEERIAEEKRKEQERIAEEKRKEEEREAEAERIERERVAEEERKEQERLAVEKQKKEDTLNGLRRGKAEGGKMLSGVSDMMSIGSPALSTF